MSEYTIPLEDVEAVIQESEKDSELTALLIDLATFAAESLESIGQELRAIGYFIGPDRVNGNSPFGNGSDETYAISVLLRILAQLSSGATDLFNKGHYYSAGALLRQIVEVEYLAWAFATKDREAEKWLRSNRQELESFFTPAKLRKAAQGKFRGKDYGYHCALGGHPSPKEAVTLLNQEKGIRNLLLSDMLGLVGRIIEHMFEWAEGNSFGEPLLKRREEWRKRFMEWKSRDPLIYIPSPP
jgi:hypothetical protein